MAINQANKAMRHQRGTLSPARTQEPTVNANDPNDRDEGPESTRCIGGSASKALNNVLANQAINTLWLPPGMSEADRTRLLKAGVAALIEFKPKDGIEGMMAAQAVGLHTAAMECLRRAMLPEQTIDATDHLRRQGANLSRAFLDVVAALDRKRGISPRQVVRVERVMVAPGAQAVVGNVQAYSNTGQHGEGIGHEEKNPGEPYAPPARLAHDAAPSSILPSVWSADPGRDALPISGDGKRPVPDARGRQYGA